MRVGIYIRVSTQEQAEEGYSIGAQKERLSAYCKARDWLVYDYYIDAGFSGSNTERPALKKLIHDVKHKKMDVVLVYKLDRLSRSQKDTLLLIEDVFNPNNVSFVSINENFDTSTSFGRAMVGILSVFAQLEREQIKERSLMGRIERAKEGLFHGGGFTPIGYDYVESQLIINEYEAMQVREVFKLFLEGNAITAIVKHMKRKKYTHKHGGWYHPATVVSALTTPIYMGKISYLGETYEGRHEAIIDEDTFTKANERYELIRWNKHDSKHKRRPFQAKYLLTGLLICGHCGARYFAKGNYSGRGDNRRYYPYYTCYSRAKTKEELVIDPNCVNPSYPFERLDKIIIGEIKKLHFDPSYMSEIQARETTKEDTHDNTIIEEQINEVDKQINRLLDLYQLGSMPFDRVTERIEKLNNQKDDLIAQLKDEDDDKPSITIDDAKGLLIHAREILDGDDFKKKRELIHSLIDTIVLDGDDILIHWAFV